jgi:hypothetical protein
MKLSQGQLRRHQLERASKRENKSQKPKDKDKPNPPNSIQEIGNNMSSIKLGYDASLAGVKDKSYALPASNFIVVAPNGNASAAGTLSAPTTLTKAVETAAAGTTVVLRGGTYRDVGNYFLGSGRPLSFQPYLAEKPIVDGSRVVTSSWTAEGSLWFTGHTHTQVATITDNNNAQYTAAAQFLKNFQFFYVNGSPLRQVATKAEVTANTFWIDNTNKRVYIGQNPAGKEVSFSARMYFLQMGSGDHTHAHHPRIFGLTIRNYAEVGLRLAIRNTLVENCHVDGGKRNIVSLAKFIVVRNCRLTNAGMMAGSMSTFGDMLYENCEVLDFFCLPYNPHWAAGGIKISATNGTVYNTNLSARGYRNFNVINCYFERSKALGDKQFTGVWYDVHATDCLTKNCYFKNLNLAIFHEICQRNYFVGNFVEDCNIGVHNMGSKWGKLANNTFINCGYAWTSSDNGRRSPNTSTHDTPEFKQYYVTEGTEAYNNLAIGCNNRSTTGRFVDVAVYQNDPPASYVAASRNNVFVRRTNPDNSNLIAVNIYRHQVGTNKNTYIPTIAQLQQTYPNLEQGSQVIGASETVLNAQGIPVNPKLFNKGFPLPADIAAIAGLPTGAVLDIGAYQSTSTAAPAEPEPEPEPGTNPCQNYIEELGEKEAEIEALANELSEALEEVGNLSDLLGIAEASLSQSQAQKSQLEADKVALQAQISSLTTQKTQLETQLAEANESIIALTGDNSQLQSDKSQLQAQVASLQEQLDNAGNSYDQKPMDYVKNYLLANGTIEEEDRVSIQIYK